MFRFTWKYGEIEITEEYDERKVDKPKDVDERKTEELEEFEKPSDYLFDIHAIKLMEKAVISNDYKIEGKKLDVGYDIVQQYINCSKNFLTYINDGKDEKISDIEKCKKVDSFIDYCREKWKVKEKNKGIDDDFSERLNEMAELGFSAEVEKIEKIYKEGNKDQPYYVYEAMVIKISELVATRRDRIKNTWCFYEQENRPYIVHEKLMCQMVLSDGTYNNYVTTVSNNVVDEVNSKTNIYLSVDSIVDEKFGEIIADIRNSINSLPGKDPAFGEHREGKKGCFSVFDMNGMRVVSLSGPWDIEDPSILSYVNFSDNKKKSNQALQTKVDNIIFQSKIKYDAQARLSLNTKRYIDNKNNVYSNGQSVADAMKIKAASSEIMNDFKCCERKIFAHVGSLVGDCKLFVKYAPCDKCRPAIKDVLKKNSCNLTFYYLKNVDGSSVVDEFDLSSL